MVLLAAITGLTTPKPAECPDPIAGTWVGMERRPAGWLRYTAVVGTPRGSVVKGRILGHFWSTVDRDPPSCTVVPHDQFVAHQPATGTFANGTLTFTARRVERLESRCGAGHRYLADRLVGNLREPSILDVVSDDGGAPPSQVVLTRIACDGPGV